MIISYDSVAKSAVGFANGHWLSVRGAIARLALVDVVALGVVALIWSWPIWRAGQVGALLCVLFGAATTLVVLSQSWRGPINRWHIVDLAWVRLLPAMLTIAVIALLVSWLKISGGELVVYWALGAGVGLIASSAAFVGVVRLSNAGKGPQRRVAIMESSRVSPAKIQSLRHVLDQDPGVALHDGANLRDAVLYGQLDEIILIEDHAHGDSGSGAATSRAALMKLPIDLTLALPSPEVSPHQMVDEWQFQPHVRVPLGDGPMWLKRLFDCVAALGLLTLLMPIMATIALLIKISSPGPVLFRQQRIGLYQQPFNIYKFRTLHDDHKDPLSLKQAHLDDPRVTPIGRFLRSTSLDELPQLLNVVIGDMALVGPRPHAPMTCVDGVQFEDLIADYALRHCVRPGLTGLAQVNGCRGPVESRAALERRLAFDLAYIKNWSRLYDIAILLRTVGVPFSPIHNPAPSGPQPRQQLRQEG